MWLQLWEPKERQYQYSIELQWHEVKHCASAVPGLDRLTLCASYNDPSQARVPIRPSSSKLVGSKVSMRPEAVRRCGSGEEVGGGWWVVGAAKSIQISDLLAFRPEVVSIMMAGGLVSDSLVLHMLMEAILQLGKDHAEVAAAGKEEEGQVSGAVVDGFPRTTLQVDLVKLLYDK